MLKTITMLATMAVLAFAGTNYAYSADVYTPRDAYVEMSNEVKTPFAGLAVGAHFGGQFNAMKLNHPNGTDHLDGISADGLLGGVHAEYLFKAGGFRVGPYVEGGFSNVNTSLSLFNGGFNAELTQESYYGGGLKAGGMISPSTLLYVKAGYDFSQYNAEASKGKKSIDVDADVGAWVLGAGAETMLSDHVSLGIEADYLLVDDVEAAGSNLTRFLEKSEGIRTKLRTSYHF